MKIFKLKIADFTGVIISYTIFDENEDTIRIISHGTNSDGRKEHFIESFEDKRNSMFDMQFEEAKEMAEECEEISVKKFNYEIKEFSEKQIELLTIKESDE
jgi:hypothetical protein